MTRLLGAAVGALALVLALIVSVAGPASAHSSQVWTLSGVTFNDGGTLSGTVTFDQSGTMIAADMNASGGNVGIYGTQHYAASGSGMSYNFRPEGYGWEIEAGGNYLHFRVPDLSGAQEGDSRPLPSGGYECTNCGNFRTINAGSLVAGALNDLDPPDLSVTIDPADPDGDNGWYVGSPTVTWDVDDPDTAVSSSTGCDPTTIDSDTTGQTVTCQATSGGGTGSQGVTIRRDATPPTITKAWLSTKRVLLHAHVTAHVNASDATSGVASATCDPSPVFSSAAGLAATWCTATDEAGNQTQEILSYTVQYAMTAPAVSRPWRAHSKVTVSTRLKDAHGRPLKASVAKSLGCQVKVALTGAQSHRACLRYDAHSHRFSATWRLGKHVGRAHLETSVGYQWSSVVTSRTTSLSIKKA